MRRYFLVALVVAATAILSTSFLYEFGFLRQAALKVYSFYSDLGLISEESGLNQLFHYLVFILAGFTTAWTYLDIPKASNKWIITLLQMLLITGLSPALLLLGVFFEPFSALFTTMFSASMLSLYSLSEPGSRRTRLHESLGDRISCRVLAQLLETGKPSFTKGEQRTTTVLVVRIFNLEDLRRDLTPRDLIDATNRFMQNTACFPASLDAFLDTASPNLTRWYFGLLQNDPDHAAQACVAAEELVQRLENLNVEIQSRCFRSVEFGIAIASGTVTSGLLRFRHSTRLGAVGDLSEFASKLCGTNAAYGSRIVISAATHSHVRDRFSVRPLEILFDARSEETTEAYELLGLTAERSAEEEAAKERFWQGIIRYREGRSEEALEIFSGLQVGETADPTLDYFIGRAQEQLLERPDHPPAEARSLEGHRRILQAT